MLPPPHPLERARLEALQRYRILDTPPEAEFDDVTKLVAAVCATPIAVINLIDADRQWFKSEIGLGVRETSRDVSICAHAILRPGLFVVPDTLEDARFARNPLVSGQPHLRFYAGALLESPDGLPLGTLCVLDYQPRELGAEQRNILAMLARTVMTQLDLRLALTTQSRLLAEKEQLLAEREVLLQELNHRIKNSLQMASSMLALQAGRIGDAEARRKFAEASARIGAIALVHERLYQADFTGRVEVGQYLRELCADLARSFSNGRDAPAITVAADRLELAIEQAVPLALIVNELVTNALKYAYPAAGSAATVTVGLQARDRSVRLEVADAGCGLPPDFDLQRAAGLGMKLVAGLAKQLGGELSFARATPGTRFVVELPPVTR
jgi:two-component sensor histidine kinase